MKQITRQANRPNYINKMKAFIYDIVFQSEVWVFPFESCVFVFLWHETLSRLAKHFPQTLHSYGFSPVWVRMWLTRWLDREKHLSQTLHRYGFSPLCTRLWLVREEKIVKILSHRLHLYGFSPLCILLWLVREPDWEKLLSQMMSNTGEHYTSKSG